MTFFQTTVETFSQTAQGVVYQCESGKLRVKAFSSIWRAKLNSAQLENALHPGQEIRVLGREGLTLIIAP